MDDIRVQVIFRVDTPHGVYQDALWFTKDEYDKVTQAGIEVKKQERISAWINIVSHPTSPLIPIKEQLQAESVSLSEQIDLLQMRKSGILARLEEKIIK